MRKISDELPAGRPWTMFVSLPMAGKTASELRSTQEAIRVQVEKKYDHPIRLLDSVIDEPPPTNNEGLWCLGVSLALMAEADFVMFAHGWEKARGCRLEHEAAKAYGIPILYCIDETQEGHTLARAIRKRMKDLDMSQVELAEQLGVSPAAVSRYCSGERIPNAYVLHSLALTLETSMEDLVLGIHD